LGAFVSVIEEVNAFKPKSQRILTAKCTISEWKDVLEENYIEMTGEIATH